MQNIEIREFNFRGIAKKIATFFGTEVKEGCSADHIQLPKKFGNGNIISVEFENGLGLLILRANLTKPFTLQFMEGNTYPMYFMHSSEGVVVHKFCQDTLQYRLGSMHCSISACPCHSKQSLIFPADQEVAVGMLSIDRRKFTEIGNCSQEELPATFINALEDKDSSGSFIYHGTSDFSISRIIQEIIELDFEKIENFAFTEGKSFEMLGQFLRNYKENQNPGTVKVAMSKYDIECIMKAKKIISVNLDNPPTIPELAKVVGINQQKLKQGFKQVFQTTINKYLIKERMEMARMLLTDGSMNVSEVAGRVGYSNKSHFSSKFKEHFGILPKDFAKTLEVTIPGAAYPK